MLKKINARLKKITSTEPTKSTETAKNTQTTETTKLKIEMNDLLKQRQSLAAQLGASLYEITRDDPAMTEGREALYSGIAQLDERRAKLEEQIAEIVLACEEIDHVDSIVTRQFGSAIYADVEVAMDPDLRLDEAHEHAESVHDAIEEALPKVKHVTVHVNPTR